MDLFLSTYIHKVDKKGRISLPALYRTVLQKNKCDNGFALLPSLQKHALEGMMFNRMEQLAHVIDNMGVYSQEQQDLAMVLMAESKIMFLDNEGRLLLPQEFLDHAHIKGQAAFVGKGHTFEIWDPVAFQQMQKESRARLSQQNVSLSLEIPSQKDNNN